MNITTSTLILIIVAVAAVMFLVGIGLGLLGGWFLWERGSDREQTPVGDLTPLGGPYAAENAVAGTVSTFIDESRYPTGDIYARYGFRAVRKLSGETIEGSESSINWNERLYIVERSTDRQEAGFTFLVPKQLEGFCSTTTFFELIVTYYSDEDAQNVLFSNLVVGSVAASADPLQIAESSDMAVNKILIS